ncbi:unnamed protein product [Rotaria sp. Silwood1]|nr:unnamed protein product [Rotaria sp. Silwood1]CAF1522343.1 unnamed protein product [Rotaria sp. Silwood1]
MTTTTTTNDEIDFDFSQFDDTLISDNQKQNLIDYINQIKNQKRSISDELNQYKLSTGNVKRRRTTKRQLLSNSISLPIINNEQTNNLQTMFETLIYIVHEINLEQIKLSTTINQLIKRINQNELYLNQLNNNIENLYEQYHTKQYSEFEIDPIDLPVKLSSSSTIIDNNYQQPIDMSTTGNNYNSIDNTTTKTIGKSSSNKEYIELGDPSIGLSCLVLKRKYDQVRRRTELAYIHGEKRAIGRLLTFLIRQFFSNEELRNASLDGRVRNTQALSKDRMSIIDKHLQTIFGIDYNLYRITKDCAEQVNVVCRHARNPKNFFDNNNNSNTNIKIEMNNNSIINQNDIVEDNEYESFQEQLFIQANEQRFHELARDYDIVHNEVVKQREIESQLRTENEQLKNLSHDIEQQLSTIRQNEQQLNTKLETTTEQVRQLSTEKEQLKNTIHEKEQENYELRKQRESLEEENHQVHETNNTTITRLQELENTSSQLQSLESLWNKERQLYIEQLQILEQSLIESKKLSIDQQTKIMQLTIQLESTEGQLQAQKRALDMGVDEKNETILNLDRQLREKTQRIEQLQTDLQRNIRQMENQQITSNKTIQSLKNQIDELLKKNILINEQYDEQNQLLVKITTERDVIKADMRSLSETFDKQSIENGK